MKRLLLVVLTLLVTQFIFSQCPDCTPDETCEGPGGPWMCPEALPDGFANVYYEEVLTFYMPQFFNDPSTGAEVDLQSVTITSVVGIPFGMEVTFNNEDLTYYPADGEEYGCATLCGTPLLPGVYEGTITISASAIVFGIEVDVNEAFLLTLVVYEGEGVNNSFSFDALTGCDSAEINFEGTINGDPQPTGWNWNFGNGETSTEQFPPTQIYEAPGDYLVTLTTQVFNLEITEVNLTDLSSGWAGDIEELFEGISNPDPYFTISNSMGDVVYTSSSVTNTTSTVWSGLSIVVTDGPFTISFYDEDAITADDFLGSYVINDADGTQNFNVNSGTTGSLDLDVVVDLEFYDEETVTVFPSTEAIFTIDDENDLMYFENPELVAFNWYLNDELLVEENSSEIELIEWGTYYCEVTNTFGCSSISEVFTYCPEFSLTFNDGTLLAPFGFDTYQWYFNGELVEESGSNQFVPTEFGTYSVQIINDVGCDGISQDFAFVSVEEISIMDLNLFPNPSSGKFQLTGFDFNNGFQSSLNIYSIEGSLVYNDILEKSFNGHLDLSDRLNSGTYILRISNGPSMYQCRLIIN